MKTKLKSLGALLLGRQTSELVLGYLSEVRASRGNLSFGQEGEDRILASLLFKVSVGKQPQNGFYVDVGAHHPWRYSNTYVFYKQGWRGINIDAAPGSMARFQRARPRDTSLEVGIGAHHGRATFYVFNEGALNTFDQELARTREVSPWKIVRTVDVPVYTLAEILDKYLPKGQAIDFLNIDVEGLDMVVLQSNDWTKFRPRIVLVETLGQDIEEALASPVAAFLKSLGYVFYSKSVNTSFFADSQYVSR